MWLHRYPTTLGCADNQGLRRKRRLTFVVGNLAVGGLEKGHLAVANLLIASLAICNLLGGLWLSPIGASLCGIQALS
jgi:hypothetical protein